MKSILLPVDFSSLSRNALDYAIAMARPFKSRITLYHCFEINVYPADASVPPLDHIQELIDEKEQSVSQQLQDWKAEIEGIHIHSSEKVEVAIKWVQGVPIEKIAEEAQNGSYDFLIMGTHGSHGVDTFFWGSTTSHIAEKVKIPLMAIPEAARFKGLDKLVYATNFKASDFVVIDQLKKICAIYSSKLTCLHVNKDPRKYIEEEKKLESLEQKFWFSPVSEMDFDLVSEGSVEAGLSHYIKNNEVKALAVYTGKHSFLESIFHQSLTKRLLNHSDIPVFVFH